MEGPGPKILYDLLSRRVYLFAAGVVLALLAALSFFSLPNENPRDAIAMFGPFTALVGFGAFSVWCFAMAQQRASIRRVMAFIAGGSIVVGSFLPVVWVWDRLPHPRIDVVWMYPIVGVTLGVIIVAASWKSRLVQ